MLNNLVCPISIEQIDSYLSRTTVFLNVLLMLAYIITQNPVFLVLVVIDYLIRAFFDVKLSPIRLLAKIIRGFIKLEPKYIDLAPKVFAARLGFVFAFCAFLVFIFGFTLISIAITSFLMTLSILDSVFDFCLGCTVYHYFVFPFYSKKNK